MANKYLPTLEMRYPNNALISLLTDLSWSVMNFDKRFPLKDSKVFVIGPAYSTMLGFKVINGEMCMGVQEPSYGKMRHIPWKLVTVIPGSPGIYVSFGTYAPRPHNFGILRFHVRSSMTKIMGHFDRLKICYMSAEGDDMSWMRGGSFYLPIKKVPGPDWA